MDKLSDAQRELFRSGGSLADYDIVKPIGKGKFSVVYRAKRRCDEVLVALKKVNIFNLMDVKAREKTLKEVRLVQSVHHPNIIQYLDAFIGQDDELCIAFEWAEAGDLKRQIRKANEKHARFDEHTIWTYFGQICAAIHHMHAHRIMHRDIKPANIFLTLSGAVKVGDLGLGRYLSENTMEAHSKVGTPLYMSPEVLRGDGYDWKCDVWSLGCILYELAMLRSPFKSEGLNLYGLFQKVNKGEYDPISDVYSTTLRSLVAHMLSLNSNDRPTLAHLCRIAATNVEPTDTVPRDRPISSSSNNQFTTDRNAINSRETTPGTPSTIEASGGSNKNESTVDMSRAFAMSELAHDKLVLLGYPFHFSIFMMIVHWLLQRIIPQIPTDVDLADDMVPPLTKASAVLVAVGLAGVDTQAMTPSALIGGFGADVCTLLHGVCDAVLNAHRPLKCVMRPSSADDVSMNKHDGDSVEWVDDAATQSNDMDDGTNDDDHFVETIRHEPEALLVHAPFHPLSPTPINATLWRAEIQRNVPTIRANSAASRYDGSPWRYRYEQWKSEGDVIVTGAADASTRLKTLVATLAKDREVIALKESQLNGTTACTTWRDQYHVRKVHQTHLEGVLRSLEGTRVALFESFHVTSTALTTTKAAVDSQSHSITDAAVLTRLRAAVATIRAENAAFDRTIAILQTSHHVHPSRRFSRRTRATVSNDHEDDDDAFR
ncbi:NEK protein kinase [Aphanomyces invadans]|uniref:non-specific serine/threonine protein kinase n=1 Tax=Aphanomyces invadans TaxID=157072 RepID=A0A024UFD5_9STRA|nr:NEK protein kinase [Aphanomyces invadans]ETW04979.1 NEK protein kinase [Aphanomyces invadans]|eukprot:XP_008866417.1 NEK protein kinase [Aphanomyces invadans]